MSKEFITTKIAIFNGKKIRKTIYNNEWWFSVVDAILALTDSVNPRDYWYRMKIRVKDEEKIELSTICRQLKLKNMLNRDEELIKGWVQIEHPLLRLATVSRRGLWR